MLVRLYDLPKMSQTEKDYRIIRPLAPDRFRVVEWVKQNSGINAAGECETCFAHTPVSMYIAMMPLHLIFLVLPGSAGQNRGRALEKPCFLTAFRQ